MLEVVAFEIYRLYGYRWYDFFFNKWCYENKFAICLEVNCFKYSPIFMREKLIFFLLPRVFSQELRLVQYKRSTCNKLWSDFWMVLCRAKSWTQ